MPPATERLIDPASVKSEGWIRRLWPFIAPHRRNVGIALSVSVVGMGIGAMAPVVVKVIVDRVIDGGDGAIAPWLALLLVIGAVGFASAYVRRFVGGRVALDVQYDLRNAIYEHLQRLDLASHDQLQTGQLVSRASSDVGLLQGLLSFLPITAGNLVTLLVSLVVMTILSPLLTVVAFVAVPLLLLVALRLRAKVFPATWDAQQRAAEVAQVVDETVTGVRVVKGFGQEERSIADLTDAAEDLYRSRARLVRVTARYTPMLQSVPAFAQVVVLALGGWLAIEGRITLGTFLAFSSYLVQLVAPVRMLAGLMAIGQQARAGAERVLELLDSTPLIVDPTDPVTPAAVEGEVTFEAASFGYLRSEPVIDGFDLHLAPGERVALVGASGSGKSTVALLLPRFYDVQSGAVRLDGHDVRTLGLDALRRQVGVVFEESFLFSSTIGENIAYGRPTATQAQIEAAARAAAAHDFISALPQGYDTHVGERGLTLSGGQRQRVALARALVTDPRVLILDDATSSVDAATEEEIQDALAVLMEGRTTLLVAHRRSTLRLADRTAVVDGGRVVAEGTHEQLIDSSPLYRALLSGPGDTLADEPTVADLGQGERASQREASDASNAGDAVDGVRGNGADRRGGHAGSPRGVGNVAARAAALVASASSDGATARRAETVGAGPAARTEAAWTAVLSDASTERLPTGTPRIGPPGGGGGTFGMALAATPALLEQLDSLPAADDRHGIDLRVAAVDDGSGRFSLRAFVSPYRWALALGLAFVVADALLTLIGPLLIRYGIDQGVRKEASGVVFATAAGFAAAVALDWVVMWASTRQTGRTAERMLLALRVRIFAHLQRLSVDYYDREMAGRIMTRMTADPEALSQLLQTGLIQAVVSAFTFVGVLVLLGVINWQLTLAVVILLPLLLAATWVFRVRSSRAYERARDRIAAVNADLQESLSGVRVAQAYVREGRNADSFRGLSGEYLDARLEAQKLVALYFPFVLFMSAVADVIVLGVGSGMVRNGTLTSGALIAFILYLDQFFSPIQQLSQVFDSYQQASVAMGRVNELMATPTTTPPPPQPVSVPEPFTGAIRFEGVHFTYPNTSQEALRGVDIDIAAGEVVALVGETGAGKSTIVKLVARFHDPTAGRVLVDGVLLTAIDLDDYRHRLGYVPQEPFLFSGTIRDNIAYGRPDSTDGQVEAAAREVGAHPFIAGLAGGYLHEITERGRSLSSGQRQLVCLARAHLVDPRILLLDEATANLDLATEARVAEAMQVVAKGRTTLVVAHRLQTAAAADRVIVMANGLVAELGTHDELLALGGRYATLWNMIAA